MKAKWNSIKFIIDHVCMISCKNNLDDLFTIKNQVLLVNLEEQDNNNKQSVPIEKPAIKKDLTEVENRFTQSWTFETNGIEVNRVYLIDANVSDGKHIPIPCVCVFFLFV
ncbi:unnamed protein product [Rotaria sordida]|uniref:Uncharacterized protein n=1 Tax=Rotaria sordida TaxID=392033 RepID=A0A814G2I9_9BILA|nr:unnamed protein product [Rotaria sordida]CAF4118547.1 unnamed protein product [Rotaria sordida]